MENNFFEPRELGFPEDKRDKYKQLVEDKYSPFHDKQLKDVFMCAFALGYKNKKKEAVKKRRPDIRFESLDASEKWILISVAITELGNIDSLLEEKNQRKVWEIAEEYANGGIAALHELVFKTGYEGISVKAIESELREALEKPEL